MTVKLLSQHDREILHVYLFESLKGNYDYATPEAGMEIKGVEPFALFGFD